MALDVSKMCFTHHETVGTTVSLLQLPGGDAGGTGSADYLIVYNATKDVYIVNDTSVADGAALPSTGYMTVPKGETRSVAVHHLGQVGIAAQASSTTEITPIPKGR